MKFGGEVVEKNTVKKRPLVLAVQKGNLTICQELLENYSSEIDVDKRYIRIRILYNV